MAKYIRVLTEDIEGVIDDLYPYVRKMTDSQYIYHISTGVPNVTVKLYSSINPEVDAANPAGQDSIKITLNDTNTGKPLLVKDARINRSGSVESMQERLVKRIDKYIELAPNYKQCPGCGNTMTILRSRKEYFFFACLNYPRCRHTEKTKNYLEDPKFASFIQERLKRLVLKIQDQETIEQFRYLLNRNTKQGFSFISFEEINKIWDKLVYNPSKSKKRRKDTVVV